LIRSGILDDGFGLAFHRERHWPLALFEVLHPKNSSRPRALNVEVVIMI
jgi:hypothetical protein